LHGKKSGNSCQRQRSGKGSDDHGAIALIDQQIAQPPQAAGDARPEILMTGHLKQHRKGYGCKKSDNGLQNDTHTGTPTEIPSILAIISTPPTPMAIQAAMSRVSMRRMVPEM